MKHPKLVYVFMSGLGVACLTVFLPNPILFPVPNLFSILTPFIGSSVWIMVSCFFSIVGTVFLTAGTCGIGSQYFKNSQNLTGKSVTKHTRLYGSIAALGIAALATFAAVLYLAENLAEVRRFFMTIPLGGLLVFIFFVLGGTTLLTVGACGIVRQRAKNNRNLLTILTAILIPSLILMAILYAWVSSLHVGL